MKNPFGAVIGLFLLAVSVAFIPNACSCSDDGAKGKPGTVDGGQDAAPASGGAGAGAAGTAGVPGTAGASGAAGQAGAGGTGGPLGCTSKDGGAACAAGAYCAGDGCVDVATSLSGLRWELPCTGAHGSVNCPCAATDTHMTTLQGTTGTTYDVTLHFRGIVEQKTYSGGTPGGATEEVDGGDPSLFISGGTPASDTWNIYELDVSSPAQTFYLNAGSSGTDQVWLIDYRATVTMNAGAVVTLTANSVEGVETFNRGADGTAVVVPGVPPAPDSYDGQFVQVDVESIAPRSTQ